MRDHRPVFLIALCILAPAGPALAQVAAPPAAEPALEEDRIAFSTNRDGNYEIYVMDPDGPWLQRLTDTPGVQEKDPCWSPNGQKLAFECNDAEIWTMWADGTGRVRLTRGKDPSWSPDGNRIAFSDSRHGNLEIYTIHINGYVTRLTSTSADETCPCWSPDGRWIAFQARSPGGQEAVYTLRADGTERTFITRGRHPSWSPDGGRLVFSSNKDKGYELYSIGVPRGVSTRLLSNDWADHNPAWSPDGTRIAFDSRPDTTVERQAAGDDEELVLIGATGRPVRQLTGNLRVADIEPSWRPRLQRLEPTPAGPRPAPGVHLPAPDSRPALER